jgi:FMN phosphatase YigB (HAD superfamily)
MYSTILSDFSRVIIKPKDKDYAGALNAIHRALTRKFGEKYNMFEYFEINEKLIDFYASLKEDYSVNRFTTDMIQNHPLIRPRLESVFSNIFAANDYGLSKKDPSAYSFIADKLAVKLEQVIYIDDQEANAEAARRAGMTVLHYTDNDNEIIGQVSLLLSKK